MLKIKFEDYKMPKYKRVNSFSEGLALVVNHEEKYGYIDQSGKEVIPCQFAEAYSFSEGLAPVKINDKYGYIDRTGNLVIEPIYLDVGYFREGLSVAKNGEKKYGYIDSTGREVIPYQFLTTNDFFEGFGIVQTMDKAYHYINKDGILSESFRSCSIFSEGMAIVSIEDEFRIISKTMEVLYRIPCHGISQMSTSSEGMIRIINKEGKVGYMDRNFQMKIPFCYSDGRDFHDGLAVVEMVKNEIIGFINQDGIATAFFKDSPYSEIDDFYEGLASVIGTNGFGFINKKGKEVIPCQYTTVGHFSEGLAYVFDGSFHYINKKGSKKITLPDLYCSTLTWNNRKMEIKAETKKELREKKIEILNQLKEDAVMKLEGEFESAKQKVFQK